MQPLMQLLLPRWRLVTAGSAYATADQRGTARGLVASLLVAVCAGCPAAAASEAFAVSAT